MTVVGVVLAGGASSRFGSDKLAAPVDGRPLLHHALEAVAQVADTLVLVLAPDAPTPPLPPVLEARIAIAHDDAAHRGPLAGLASALGTLGPSDLALVAGGDMPTLVPGVLRLLLDALAADDALDAVTLDHEDPAPLPMAVRGRVLAPARDLLARDRRSLRALLGELRVASIPATRWRALDPDGRTLRDVDSPDDLALS